MPRVLFLGPARDVTGVPRAFLPGTCVDEVMAAGVDWFGPALAALLGSCQVWVNGEPSGPSDHVGPDDEVAVLPPVSGG